MSEPESDSVPCPRTTARPSLTIGFTDVLADTPTLELGYQGITVIRSRRKRLGRDHDTATRLRSINALRTAVERAIAHWKTWKILATGYCGRLSELPHIICTITTLSSTTDSAGKLTYE